jgi:hypothetical protein
MQSAGGPDQSEDRRNQSFRHPGRRPRSGSEYAGCQGVEIVSGPKDVPNGGGDRFAFVHDNERMLVELLQPG